MSEGAKELLAREMAVVEYAHEHDQRQALCKGYRLGLVAAIEEIEKTASLLPFAMQGELRRLAVRIHSRQKDTEHHP